ncbi:S-adenosyl-L-methionine-dependent methyltransferase [Stereum hirsutum FP-91666 SS1]|uniref:S-adenosyl-L-methionine-dependent methyltransferase n=1 Tax=Stereum hirsutum (strain FP-91666) TaxID=721885 RepID=UPI0004449AB0|nr:S-adenosyl-L-methionine-dependent methyltransferase [Stereum hirsutum FP-91666 SS1]EIM86299.1 S-adenosyl-L-methionine-dependent methyltransferase [Stereum hirsutum FP-91666 SS1]
MAAAELTPLVDLITDAVKDVIKEYDTVGQPFPALGSTNSGHFDSAASVTPELARAIKVVEAACAQLSFSVASPAHVMTNKAFGFEEPVCLQIVTESGVADLLVDLPEGLHIEELAKKSGIEVDKLGRVLRLLATKHCFIEVKPNVFANNRISMTLVSGNHVSSLVGHLSGEALKSAAQLADIVTDPVAGHCNSANATACDRAMGFPLMSYYQQAPKEIVDRVQSSMIAFAEVCGKHTIPNAYPWNDLPDGAILCDIGGGTGHISLDVLKAFAHLRVLVQDLEVMKEPGAELWTKMYPEAIANGKVSFVTLDLFAEPPVEGCHVYFMNYVLHDWPAAESMKMLANVRKAMKPHSKLLIRELIIEHVSRPQEEEAVADDRAPEPLLPNYGMGNVFQYNMDLNMMALLNAKERTLAEFVDLGKKTGFRFVKLYVTGKLGLLEFVAA